MDKKLVLALLSCVLMAVGCVKQNGPSADLKSLKKFINEQPAKVEDEYGLRLAEGVLCRNVENRRPTGVSDMFFTGAQAQVNVYFFTRIVGKNQAGKVFHRFCELVTGINGPFWKETYKKELSIESTNYRTWTYKTCTPGIWRADLLGPDGNDVMKTVVFEVAGPTPGKIQVPTNPSIKPDDLTLLESFTCEKVEDRKPVNPGETFSLDAGQSSKDVWVWLHCKTEKTPSMVYLRWSDKQTAVEGTENWVAEFVQKLEIKGKDWKTYAWRTCPEGVSRLDIIGPDGKTVLKTTDVSINK